jgi:BirA family biotin operon repressor/biotin-[acetyl-CoA-carboxylase] ligase
MGWLGHERIHLARCASTNDEAAARARRGAAHGLIVTADTQRAGRGRQGRSWHSPDGGDLYLSCVLRPELAPADVPPIALAAGIAVAEAVNAAGARASVKWPNDVLAGGKKVAGLLAEMSSRGGAVDAVILGIGVNLVATSFPDEIADRATSVALAGGDGDRERFIGRLLEPLERWIDRYVADGIGAIRAVWDRVAYAGPVAIDAGGDRVVGIARGVDDGGALIVEAPSGARHRVVAGDVELVPSTGESR